MSDWREHPPMSYEEMYGYQRGRVESRDLGVYIGGTVTEQHDYASRMAAGLACPSCATPFPSWCSIANLKVWEAECPNLFSSPIADGARRLISQGCCPFCQIEVSTPAFNLLVSGL
ncbi:MAG: hypothetical protein H0X39_00020 [Actinobacteria bacterium]|nr:hypothetical protein [Actinomycetota bacterium]